jgi:hypothetical protein
MKARAFDNRGVLEIGDMLISGGVSRYAVSVARLLVLPGSSGSTVTTIVRDEHPSMITAPLDGDRRRRRRPGFRLSAPRGAR